MTTAIAARPDRGSIIQAHGRVLENVREQHAAVREEVAQLTTAVEKATEHKWETSTLKRQLARMKKHEAFLAKVEQALEAGYTIMPNLNLELIAVRTDREERWGESTDTPSTEARKLPAGEGDYFSDIPFSTSRTVEKTGANGNKYDVMLYRPTRNAPVAVPFLLMKTELADILAGAMAEKLFDEIGLVTDQQRDPFLVGRILHPKARTWNHRGVSFFLGWWFDPRVLRP